MAESYVDKIVGLAVVGAQPKKPKNSTPKPPAPPKVQTSSNPAPAPKPPAAPKAAPAPRPAAAAAPKPPSAPKPALQQAAPTPKPHSVKASTSASAGAKASTSPNPAPAPKKAPSSSSSGSTQQTAIQRVHTKEAKRKERKAKNSAVRAQGAVRKAVATYRRKDSDAKRIKRVLGVALAAESPLETVVLAAKEFASAAWHEAHDGQTCSRWQHGKDRPKAVACRESGGKHLGACAEHKKEMTKG